MASQNIHQVPVLAHLFIKVNLKGDIKPSMANFVHYFLIVGPRDSLYIFYETLRNRLEIGRYIVDQYVIFNGHRIRKLYN